jgi:hypothetical protein
VTSVQSALRVSSWVPAVQIILTALPAALRKKKKKKHVVRSIFLFKIIKVEINGRLLSTTLGGTGVVMNSYFEII